MDSVTTEGFCPVDLADWVALAEEAGVPAVPTRVVATSPTASMTMFDVDEGDHVRDLRRFFSDFNAAVAAEVGQSMARWSCCSSSDLKVAVNSGRRDWSDRFLRLTPDDMRAYDIISEFPRPTIAAHLRPWLPLAVRSSPVGTYGLEARVFVEDGEVRGVSAYYPQCPLSEGDADVVRLVAKSGDYARRLIAKQAKPLALPQVPTLHGRRVNSWSVDFVMTEGGDVLLLEGGPPHTSDWGAHPCCFGDGHIDGIALVLRDAGA